MKSSNKKKKKKQSRPSFLLFATLTSLRCSTVFPRVFLNGIEAIVAIVIRGGAAAGRAHRRRWRENDMKKRGTFCFSRLLMPVFLSLPRDYCSLSWLGPPFYSVSCVNGSQRNTQRQAGQRIKGEKREEGSLLQKERGRE